MISFMLWFMFVVFSTIALFFAWLTLSLSIASALQKLQAKPESPLGKRKRLLDEANRLGNRLDDIEDELAEILSTMGVSPTLNKLIEYLAETSEQSLEAFLEAIQKQKEVKDRVFNYVGWLIADCEHGLIRFINLSQQDAEIQAALVSAMQAIAVALRKGEEGATDLELAVRLLQAARTQAAEQAENLSRSGDTDRYYQLVNAGKKAESASNAAESVDLATGNWNQSRMLVRIIKQADGLAADRDFYAEKLLQLLRQ